MVRARFNVDRMLRLAHINPYIAQIANSVKAQSPHARDKEVLLHVYTAYVKPNKEMLRLYNNL